MLTVSTASSTAACSCVTHPSGSTVSTHCCSACSTFQNFTARPGVQSNQKSFTSGSGCNQTTGPSSKSDSLQDSLAETQPETEAGNHAGHLPGAIREPRGGPANHATHHRPTTRHTTGQPRDTPPANLATHHQPTKRHTARPGRATGSGR